MVSSFVNMNDTNWQGEAEAGVLLRLNLNSGNESEIRIVKDKLNYHGIPDKNIKRLFLGKCVLEVNIPPEILDMKWYSSDGIFNGESDFYKDYISSSRSYWVIEKENIPGVINITVDGKRYQDKNNCHQTEVAEDFLLSKCEKIPIAQFVIKEYQRLIEATQSGWRSPVLKMQFESVKKIYAGLC